MKKTKILLASVFITLITYNLQSATCHAESEISQVEKLFLEARYEKVIVEAGKLIDARVRHRDELYYLKALSELKTNKFNEARRTFETLLEKYPRSKRALDAYVGIGDAYFLEGRYDEAVKRYNEALSRFPDDQNTPVLYQRLGECHKKTGAVDKADDYLNKAKSPPPVNFTPKSNFVPQEVPRQSQGSVFSAQVGSFKNKRNAAKLSKKLREEGYESFVEIPVGTGDMLYRVKVGRLNSRQEAENLAARLKRSGYKIKICGD